MIKAYRASVLHFFADPAQVPQAEACQYLEDGLLVIEGGHVRELGPASDLLPRLAPGTELVDYRDALILPGFVDTHVHYPQTQMIASYGEQLLQWLETYTFPTEARFADSAHATAVAEQFLDELLRAGTTTAMVFCTVHRASAEAFFEACARRNLRMIAGKCLMDRNAPAELCDTPATGIADTRSLIDRWHGHGRLRYAVTPRFAATSSPEQLRQAGELLREFPDVHLQTHLAENRNEVAWVAELFPDCANYLDCYDRAGLVGPRSVFAHCVHLQPAEWSRLAASGAAIAFCPTSNLFLGSGLFRLPEALRLNIPVGLGTDVGAGTSFSMLQTLNEAYKVLQLQGGSLAPLTGLYLATLGGATALRLDHCIGNFERGKEADFVVLDRAATPLLAQRMRQCHDLSEQLFALSILGDDRAVAATYAAGECVHSR